ncbi:CRE-UGT-52 protein [Ditylenchus destructor]|nr:CRE-UGT-52 protein [Ditylenchus destructor]
MLNFLSRAFLLLLWLPQFSAALKILMYQTAYSPSHMGFSGTLVDILTQAGHTVDKLIMEFNPNVESNGSTRLRHVYRIQLSGDNPFMNLKHMTHPFEHFNFLPDQGYHHTKNMLCEGKFFIIIPFF